MWEAALGNQPGIFTERTDAEAETSILWEEPTHWKGPWCWERLRAGGQGGDRGWDGWMASPTQQTWIWASSGSWWWTGKPGVLQSMGSQRVGHNWATAKVNSLHLSHSLTHLSIPILYTSCFPPTAPESLRPSPTSHPLQPWHILPWQPHPLLSLSFPLHNLILLGCTDYLVYLVTISPWKLGTLSHRGRCASPMPPPWLWYCTMLIIIVI